MNVHLPLELQEHPEPERLYAYAEKLVLDYCSEQVDKVEGGKPYRASRTIIELRNHFDTIKASKLAEKLNVSFTALIDDLLQQRRIMVTNGFVWVREGKQ